MNDLTDFERRIADFYAREAPPRAPDWVLDSALATIESTSQRHALVGVAWRLNRMNGFAKLAVAAVVVVAAGILGISVLRPAGDPGPGGPVVSPSASPSPSPAPSSTPTRTTSPYEPPPLSETFTSARHGVSLSYPAGWTAQPATQSWTLPGLPLFRDAAADFVYDPARMDHLFLAAASRPLGGQTLEEWTEAGLSADGCGGVTGDIAIDGVDGLFSEDCGVATVASGGRAYLFWHHVSGDNADLRAWDSQSWFEEVLATVNLDPESAIDVGPSAS